MYCVFPLSSTSLWLLKLTGCYLSFEKGFLIYIHRRSYIISCYSSCIRVALILHKTSELSSSTPKTIISSKSRHKPVKYGPKARCNWRIKGGDNNNDAVNPIDRFGQMARRTEMSICICLMTVMIVLVQSTADNEGDLIIFTHGLL